MALRLELSEGSLKFWYPGWMTTEVPMVLDSMGGWPAASHRLTQPSGVSGGIDEPHTTEPCAQQFSPAGCAPWRPKPGGTGAWNWSWGWDCGGK